MSSLDYSKIGTETDLRRAQLHQRARAIGLIRTLWAKRRDHWHFFHEKCYLMDSPSLSDAQKAELEESFSFIVTQAIEADRSIRDMIRLVRETDAALYKAAGSQPEH